MFLIQTVLRQLQDFHSFLIKRKNLILAVGYGCNIFMLAFGCAHIRTELSHVGSVWIFTAGLFWEGGSVHY